MGKAPFSELNLMQLLRALTEGKTRSARAQQPSVTTAMDDLICRAMRTPQTERFGSMEQMGKALWRLAEEPTRALWATQFGDANFTAPILGTSTSPVGLTSPGLVVRQNTVREQPPAEPRQRAWRDKAAATALFAAALLFFGVGLDWLPTFPSISQTNAESLLARPVATPRRAPQLASPSAVRGAPRPQVVATKTAQVVKVALAKGDDNESTVGTSAGSKPDTRRRGRRKQRRRNQRRPRTGKRKKSASLQPDKTPPTISSRVSRATFSEDESLAALFGLSGPTSASSPKEIGNFARRRGPNEAPILDQLKGEY